MAATHNSFRADEHTTTDVVPVIVQGEVVAEHVGSHNIVELGKLDLSRALQEFSVSLDQLHGLDVLSSGNVALINSLHLHQYVRRNSKAEKQTPRWKLEWTEKLVHPWSHSDAVSHYLRLEYEPKLQCNKWWSLSVGEK